jgi:hypothetical protein
LEVSSPFLAGAREQKARYDCGGGAWKATPSSTPFGVTNVSVSRPALLALQDAIQSLGELEPDAQQGNSEAFTSSEQGALLETLIPNTPLATFEIDGQPQTFTFADYAFWLQRYHVVLSVLF